MKHLLLILFFGYLPLGWKRLFRVASFGWFLFILHAINDIGIESLLTNEINLFYLLLLYVISPFILSYLINGFIKQKKH